MFVKLFLITFTICQTLKLGKTTLMKKVSKKIISELLEKLKFVIIWKHYSELPVRVLASLD